MDVLDLSRIILHIKNNENKILPRIFLNRIHQLMLCLPSYKQPVNIYVYLRKETLTETTRREKKNIEIFQRAIFQRVVFEDF